MAKLTTLLIIVSILFASCYRKYHLGNRITSENFPLKKTKFEGFQHNPKRYLDAIQPTNASTFSLPLHLLIISTWGTGSRLIANTILNDYENQTFYFDEPLQSFGIQQIGTKHKFLKSAQAQIDAILNCQFTTTLFDYKKLRVNIFPPSLRTLCSRVQCLNPFFLKKYCEKYPSKMLRILRLNLNVVRSWLENLPVHVLFVVRDPRAIIHYRETKSWCQSCQVCYNPNLLCFDMVQAYYSARKLHKAFPRQFRVVRFEDFERNVPMMVARISEFYALDLDVTKPRRSNLDLYEWQWKMSNKTIKYLEKNCKSAMDLWGYRPELKETDHVLHKLENKISDLSHVGVLS